MELDPKMWEAAKAYFQMLVAGIENKCLGILPALDAAGRMQIVLVIQERTETEIKWYTLGKFFMNLEEAKQHKLQFIKETASEASDDQATPNA